MGRDKFEGGTSKPKKALRLGEIVRVCVQNSELANPKSDEEKSLFDERKVAYIKDEYEAFMVGMFFKACETRDGGLGLNYAFCKDECEAFGVEITEAWGVLGVMLSEAIKSLSQKIR